MEKTIVKYVEADNKDFMRIGVDGGECRMNEEMENRIRRQLSLSYRKDTIYCNHNNEKACKRCMSEIQGDVSGILGNVSDIRGNVSGIRGDVSDIWGDVSEIWGDVSEIWGDLSGILGNVSDIRGNVSGIWGDVSDIWGDASGIRGDASDILKILHDMKAAKAGEGE